MYAMPLCSDTVFDFYSVDEWDAMYLCSNTVFDQTENSGVTVLISLL